jgi:hypothetical protein
MRTITDTTRVMHVHALDRDSDGALVGDIIDIPNLACRTGRDSGHHARPDRDVLPDEPGQ